VTHFSIQIPEFPHLNPFVANVVIFEHCAAVFNASALCCTYGTLSSANLKYSKDLDYEEITIG
ncbi:MAG: hypothetical protein KKG64_04655, partial [Firmicutes bacterium]|nr:hypothetical protein [Bacillota bacterium]